MPFAVGEHFSFCEAGKEPDGLFALTEAEVVFVHEGQLAHHFAQAFGPVMVPVACAFAPGAQSDDLVQARVPGGDEDTDEGFPFFITLRLSVLVVGDYYEVGVSPEAVEGVWGALGFDVERGLLQLGPRTARRTVP